MKFTVLCATLVLTPAFANDLVAYNGGDSVHLSDSPCSSVQVLGYLPPQLQSDFKAASAVLGGHPFAACWRVQGGAAHVLYEDGDQGLIPLSVLKPELNA